MLNVEHRKNFAVIILNSRRLVVNFKRTDPKCLTRLSSIKSKLGTNYEHQNDAHLFTENAESSKMFSVNKEQLWFYNLDNNMQIETTMNEFETALRDQTFKCKTDGNDTLYQEPRSIRVPETEVALHTVYDVHRPDSVIDYDCAKNVIVRKQKNVIHHLPVLSHARHVDSHRLLNCKPLYLTIKDVYENLDFESFVHDIERLNENVESISRGYDGDDDQQRPNQAKLMCAPSPQPPLIQQSPELDQQMMMMMTTMTGYFGNQSANDQLSGEFFNPELIQLLYNQHQEEQQRQRQEEQQATQPLRQIQLEEHASTGNQQIVDTTVLETNSQSSLSSRSFLDDLDFESFVATLNERQLDLDSVYF